MWLFRVRVIDCYGMVMVIKRINVLEWLYATIMVIGYLWKGKTKTGRFFCWDEQWLKKALQGMNIIRNENNLNIFKDFHHLNVKGHAINIRTLNSDWACTHTQHTGIPISVNITYISLNLCILLYYNKRNMIPVNLTRKILNLRLK